MKLIARKACSFGGKKFFIGDEIPAELVLRPNDQEKWGVLAIVHDDASTPAAPETVINEVDTMAVDVNAKDGKLSLNLTKEGLQSVVDVLTAKASDAETIIDKMTDGDALILIHIADNRKTVKEAAETRAQALEQEPEEAGEQ